jgi:predicted Holliday junction resolvase-like endonuclease
MKRKFVIIMVAQSLLILLLFTFALLQKAEADKQRELAEELYKRAAQDRIHAENTRLQLDSLKGNDAHP